MGTVAKFIRGYYYGQLDVDQKYLYQKLGMAIADFEPSVSITEHDFQILHKVMTALKYDNPEFFYFSPEDTEVTPANLVLYYNPAAEEEAAEQVQDLRKKRKILIQALQQENRIVSQKDMLQAIYQYLTEHVAYADDELQKPACSPWIYSIQGPLLREKAVCLGIALTVNYLCSLVHIPSLLITGEAKVGGWNVNHGWNMVQLDGEYYHLDVTCEITEKNAKGDTYFLLKEEALADRKWARNLYPAAPEGPKQEKDAAC